MCLDLASHNSNLFGVSNFACRTRWAAYCPPFGSENRDCNGTYSAWFQSLCCANPGANHLGPTTCEVKWICNTTTGLIQDLDNTVERVDELCKLRDTDEVRYENPGYIEPFSDNCTCPSSGTS